MTKRLVLVIALLALAGPATAQQGRAGEVERIRRRTTEITDLVAAREAVDPVALRARTALYAITQDDDGTLLVDVFLRATPSAEGALRAAGVRLGARAGEWMTARVPMGRLAQVARIAGVRRVELSRRAYPLDDSSSVDIGLPALRERPDTLDLFERSTGRGAIVGVVDTGIDFRHPDFLEDDQGRSRVLYLWDQNIRGPGPGRIGSSQFAYGLECQRAELGATGTCRSRDFSGHGTHVAGTAAGDGSAARRGARTFAQAGVAPGAELIVVAANFSFTGIADGIDYIFRRAEQLGRPAVVNLSLGSQFGPHDGDEALSLMIDALSGPGRIVVAAAGNDGFNAGDPRDFPRIHAEGSAPVSDSVVIELNIPPYTTEPGLGNDFLLLNAYYSANDRYDATIVRPNGTRVTVPAGGGTATSLDPAGTVVAYNGTVAGDSVLGPFLMTGDIAPASTARMAEFYIGEVVDGSTPPVSGNWRLVFRRAPGSSGSGVIDAYIPLYTMFPNDTVALPVTFTTGATNRRVVGSLATARSAVTVASYSTRRFWPASNDSTYRFRYDTATQRGNISFFSSPGPTRDGRAKPDISAPGRVFSSMSRDLNINFRLVHPDSSHVLFEGTSMAAPHVAGVIALMLAERTTLTPAEVKSVLASTARQDEFTSRSFATNEPSSSSWGAGKLNAAAAVAAVRPATPLAGRAIAVGSVRDYLLLHTSDDGSLVPLQQVRISATDPESLAVLTLGATVRGQDPSFRLAAVLDLDRDRVLDENEPVVGTSAPVALDGERVIRVPIQSGSVVVPRGGTEDVLLVGVLSGERPVNTLFSATVLSDSSTAVGLRSGRTLSFTGQPIGPARATVLARNQRVNLSANPVRENKPLVINFAEAARRIDIYDFAGRLVRSFQPAATARSLQWNLQSDDGVKVGNGTYILVVDLPSGVVRRKLFLAR